LVLKKSWRSNKGIGKARGNVGEMCSERRKLGEKIKNDGRLINIS
jgi:hypothetical protein